MATPFYGAAGDSGELITLGQIQIRYLRDGAAEGQVGAFEMLVPSNSNVPPPHSHAHNEEYIYVLEGKLRYSVNGEVQDLTEGESARRMDHYLLEKRQGKLRRVVHLNGCGTPERRRLRAIRPPPGPARPGIVRTGRR